MLVEGLIWNKEERAEAQESRMMKTSFLYHSVLVPGKGSKTAGKEHILSDTCGSPE